MKKPEKIIIPKGLIPKCMDYVKLYAFNQAIDDYEKYHNWRMEQLPDEEEIEKILRDCWNNLCSVAEAIAKRIGK